MSTSVIKDIWEAKTKYTASARGPVDLEEKVRALWNTGRFQLLPYLDPYTEETQEMRNAYRTMLRSAVASAALKQKVYAVASLDLTVTPADDTPRDREIAAFCEYAYKDVIEGGPCKVAESVLLPGLVDGLSIAEKVWHLDLWPRGKWRGKRFYRDLKSKDTHGLLVRWDRFRNIESIRPSIGVSIAHGVQEYPPTDFAIFRNLPLFEGSGISDLRAAYSSFWMLDTIEKLHAIHLERFTSPIVTATYADAQDQEAVEKNVAGIGARGWFVGPESVKFQALQLATRGEADFLAKCQDLREQIALAISGAFLQMLASAASGGDMRGDSSIHKTTSELFVWALSTKLACIYDDQLTPQLVDENYQGADYPKVQLGGVNYGEMLQAIQIDEKAQQMGFKLSKKSFATKYNLQAAADPSDELVLPAQAPPPQIPGAGPRFFAPAPAETGAIRLPDVRQQKSYDCGAAAVRCVLDHFGRATAVDLPALREMLDTNAEDGTTPDSIIQGLRALGLEAYGGPLTLQGLDSATEGNCPVICPIKQTTGAGHWIVVSGIDGDQVLMQDPVSGPGEIPAAEFVERWRDTDADGRDFVQWGIVVSPGTRMMAEGTPSSDIALHGADGKKAAALLQASLDAGAAKMAELSRAAVERMLASPEKALKAKTFFDAADLDTLADQLRDTLAPADLLGRARIRERQQQAEQLQGSRQFSAEPTTFRAFDEGGPLQPMSPQQALDYFTNLLPGIAVDAGKFARALERQAFTLAVTTDETLLGKVQDIIRQKLATGQGVGKGEAEIDAVLEQASVAPSNPGYSEMVLRTNMMDAYNTGAERELAEVQDTFPVWQYANPNDGRSRPEHAAKNRRYYSSSRSFAEVRGGDAADVIQCRCTFIPIDKWEWADLQKAGAKLEA